MKDKLTTIVNKQRHPRKPILYWTAHDKTGKVIDQNNSIAILRHKYGNSVIYKTVR